MVLAASLVSPLSLPTSIYAEKEGELSLLPIFFLPGPSALCCSFIQMGGEREGHSPSLSFPPAKMHAPHSALSSPDNHSGGGRGRASDGGEGGGFPVPFRYNVGGGVICIPGRLGHSLPSSSPFPAAPPPVFSEFGCRGGESRERLPPSPPSDGHTTSRLLFPSSIFSVGVLPCSKEPSREEGRGGKLRGLHLSQAILGVLYHNFAHAKASTVRGILFNKKRPFDLKLCIVGLRVVMRRSKTRGPFASKCKEALISSHPSSISSPSAL